MSSKPRSSGGNILFWLVLIASSAGAFGAGFFITYGHTVNINAKAPGEEGSHKGTFARGDARTPPLVPSARPSLAPSAAPTPAPGLIGNAVVVSASPAARPAQPDQAAALATPTPLAAAATPAPRQVRATPEPAAPAQPEIYRVQVGPFDDRATADKQVVDLQAAGINAVVVFDQGKYQAQLGAFTDRARAISVAEEVNTRGYSVTIRH